MGSKYYLTALEKMCTENYNFQTYFYLLPSLMSHSKGDKIQNLNFRDVNQPIQYHTDNK